MALLLLSLPSMLSLDQSGEKLAQLLTPLPLAQPALLPLLVDRLQLLPNLGLLAVLLITQFLISIRVLVPCPFAPQTHSTPPLSPPHGPGNSSARTQGAFPYRNVSLVSDLNPELVNLLLMDGMKLGGRVLGKMALRLSQ